MRTIEIKIYDFSELSPTAQAKAIDNCKYHKLDTTFVYQEAHKTVKQFNLTFGTNEGNRSWLDVVTNFEDEVLNLKGLRLRTWLINNHWHDLFKGKYYGKLLQTFKNGEKTPKSKEHPAGLRHLKRYSKVFFDNSCVLTGVCYDHSLLQPMYDFIEWKDPQNYQYYNIEDIIEQCFYSLKRDIENEVEAMHEDDYIIEQIEANGYEFTEDGEFWYETEAIEA